MKLLRTLHAEQNAILFAARDLTGCTLYVTHPPCARCTALLIQAGIREVVYPPVSVEFAERWADDLRESALMLSGARVVYGAVR